MSLCTLLAHLYICVVRNTSLFAGAAIAFLGSRGTHSTTAAAITAAATGTTNHNLVNFGGGGYKWVLSPLKLNVGWQVSLYY
jgi:hypothetical protein